MERMRSSADPRGVVTVSDPPVAFALFSTTRFAWLWLLIRLYAGWQWLTSGWGKLGNSAWWSGEALGGFWARAIEVPTDGRAVITYGWYRDFIQFMYDAQWYIWFGKLIMFGEIATGVALIVGLLVGIAAFFGGFMNWNFIMAGTASTNGLMFVLAIALMLAWKVAGWYGLDRWLLPLLGTPWEPGPVAARHPRLA